MMMRRRWPRNGIVPTPYWRAAIAMLGVVFGAVVLSTALVAPAALAAGPGDKHGGLPDLPLAIGQGGDVGWYVRNGEAMTDWSAMGSWSVTDARIDPDGTMRFHVSISPQETEALLDAGPATLMAGLSLYGGLGGDAGYDRVVQTRFFDAGSCSGSPCMYEADVVLDATRIPQEIKDKPHVHPVAAEVDLSLVRTYGQGEWLQVLDLLVPEQSQLLGDWDGTLREPEGTSGSIVSGGIFRARDTQASRDGRHPAFDLASEVEASRIRQGDTSLVTPSVRVDLQVDVVACRVWEPIWIIDGSGVVALEAVVGAMDPAGEIVEVPSGGDWRLGLRNPWPGPMNRGGASAGGFTTATSDLRVEATFDCSDRDAPVTTGIVIAQVDAIPDATTGGGWSVVRESWSGRHRAPRPFVVGSDDAGLLSLESTPTGWKLRRSDDGWRWRAHPLVVRGRDLPDHGSAEHARLISTDKGLLLAMVVHGSSGRPRLETWTSPDGERWRASSTTALRRLPAPVTDLLFAAADGLVVALARGAHRSRLLTSLDGRTWDAVDPGDIVAVGSGVDRIVGVTEHAGRTTVAATTDGTTWEPLADVPPGALGPFRVAESPAGLLLAATGGTPGTAVWSRGPADSDWHPVLGTRSDLRIDDIAVNGDEVVIAGRVKEPQARGFGQVWIAASHDGGRRWRQSLLENVNGRCHLRPAASETALVAGTADCDDQPTVWRAEPAADDRASSLAADEVCLSIADDYDGSTFAASVTTIGEIRSLSGMADDARLRGYVDDQVATVCTIDADIAKSPPPPARGTAPPSFDRVVVILVDEEVVAARFGYRDAPPAVDWGPLAVVDGGGGPDVLMGPGTLSIGADRVTFKADGGAPEVALVWGGDRTSWRLKNRQVVLEHHQDGIARLSDDDRVSFGGMALEQDLLEASDQLSAWLEASWLHRGHVRRQELRQVHRRQSRGTNRQDFHVHRGPLYRPGVPGEADGMVP